MFSSQNKIIIVDDVQSHLDTLASQFHNKGIGCKACLYDAHFDTPFKGVRIAFFDININPNGGGSDSQRMNSLAAAIQQYIAEDNGPFALIFWTSNSGIISQFKTHIQTRFTNFPKPFFINFIDKDTFLQGAATNLEQKLSELLSNPILKVLFDFENLSNSAAAKTIDEIHKIIPHETDVWGEPVSFNINFEIIFSKIASNSLGFDHAKALPDKAVLEALIPIQNHFILKNDLGTNWRDVLTTLRSANSTTDIETPLKKISFKDSLLNGVFHIEQASGKKDVRGIVLEIKKHKKTLARFFPGDYSTWVKTFVPFKKNFSANETIAKTAAVEKLIKDSTLIAIEISSSCDFSQNKSRLNKYVLGFKTKIIDAGLREKKGPEASMYLGIFNFKNEEFEIFLNLTHVFGAQTNDKYLGDSLFVFKKEIMDMIGNRYANHISRIGITSF